MNTEPQFSFPYKPYDIQNIFMKELYSTFQNSKLGIFESPTGTGKSLSICCGTLQWLKDDYNKKIQELEIMIKEMKKSNSSSEKSEDWLQEEYEKIKRNQQLASLQIQLEKLKLTEQKYVEMKQRVEKHKLDANIKKITYKEKEKLSIIDTEHKNEFPDDNLEDQDLVLEDVQEIDKEGSDDECVEQNNDSGIKVFISSRTHSQLSQFVGEIKRTVFNNVRVVTLASRQHYCINPDVSRSKNNNLINERCLDLQKATSKTTSKCDDGKILKKSKTKSCSACPFYNQTNINHLKERVLVDIMDMEDIVKSGKELKACPYYASRMAMHDAQVVLITHAGIVSSGARAGMSLDLNNNILILDEAHGLTAALESAHSSPLSSRQLNSVNLYLNYYINKYRARLSCKSMLSLNQVAYVVKRLLSTLKQQNKSQDAKIYTLQDYLAEAEIDHLNLRPLVEFCRNTRLAPKLHGFSMRYSQQALEEAKKPKENKKNNLENFLSKICKKNEVAIEEKKEEENVTSQPIQPELSAGSSLYAVLDFLSMLCDRCENGRVLLQKDTEAEKNGHLKYLLLNPAEHFSDVVKQCRSVVVAGGTMEPISEFKSLLTSDNEELSKQITVLSCDHVVPADNVLGICLSKGPSGLNLNFTYENRLNKDMLDEVGRILRNICGIVPGGVVCFLPSYTYEDVLYEHLKKNNVIDSICRKKKVFREPKSAADVEQVLHKFASAVKSKADGMSGALLLSVVGGKLSEGLNFSDDLGRCVMVVGMPYPNIKSPELQEKMNYLNRTSGVGSGNVYYENLCMKAVNQCIGRAVRHINDYATVILVDERYSRLQTISALPSFVQKSLMPNCNFGSTMRHIAQFFSKHKEKQ